MRRVVAEHADLAAVPVPVALEDLDRGCLPRSVRAEQGEDLTGPDIELDAAHSGYARIALDQPADAHRWLFGTAHRILAS